MKAGIGQCAGRLDPTHYICDAVAEAWQGQAGTMAARSIKSAERTLALFELFSREQRPFTVGRVSDALDVPQASASMLLRNLADLGYLEYDRKARTFAPSIR